jgi:hypothetical protein
VAKGRKISKGRHRRRVGCSTPTKPPKIGVSEALAELGAGDCDSLVREFEDLERSVRRLRKDTVRGSGRRAADGAASYERTITQHAQAPVRE